MTFLARAVTIAAAFALVAASQLNAQSSKFRVTIAGGPNAGTYEKTDFCELKDTFPSMFIMAYTVTPVPKNPQSIEFFTAPGKGKPDGFLLKVNFSEPGKSTPYEIFAIPRELYPPGQQQAVKGKGTVTIRQAGAGRIATFRGQTADGVRIEGSVDCRNDSP